MSRSSYNRPNSSLRSTIHGQSSPSDSDQELVEHSVVKRAHASAKDRLATHNSKRAARKASRSAPTHSPSHLPPTEHDEHKFPPPSSSSEHEHDADHGGEKRSMWGGRRYGTHTKDLELGPEEPLSEEEEEKHHLVHGEQEWHGEHRHPPSRWKRMPKKEKLEVVVTGVSSEPSCSVSSAGWCGTSTGRRRGSLWCKEGETARAGMQGRSRGGTES